MSTSAAAVSTPAAAEHGARPALLVGALGVVFGDIGTSPIYAFRESLRAAGGAAAQATALRHTIVDILGRRPGRGSQVCPVRDARRQSGRRGHDGIDLARAAGSGVLLTIGLGGASLFFGDAMITPAISVLSAIEGVQIATPALKPYVVAVAAGVLIALFAIQSRGSGRMGRLFGPVMAAWFVALGPAGIVHLAAKPEILVALNPRYALAYVAHADGWVAFTVLGSVFLALTGGEALYTDMGHFGRRAIRIDWFSLVMLALVLNYFGQGALVLSDPAAASDPFFLLFPRGLLVAIVVLTTAATVIASQAVISGAFTLVQQAIQLGAVPRLEVRQTSDKSGRSGLFTPHQLAAANRSARAGSRLPQLGRPCQRLRHRCRRRYAGHLYVGHDCGPRSLALALVRIAARRRSIPRDRRPKSMSATHAGSTSGGNLCHLLVRRARNLAMSKSVASVVVMRFLFIVPRGPWGREDQRTYHPAATPTPHQEFDCRRPFSHPDTSGSRPS